MTQITVDINDARTLLAIAHGRLSDAKGHVAELEQLANSIAHRLAAAHDELERAQGAYDRATAILEK